VTGAFGKRADAGVDDAGARLHGLQVRHVRQPRGGVAVGMDGQVGGGADLVYQFECGIRREQARHVLDRDGVAAHLRQSLGEADEVRDVVHRAGGVAERAFGMLAGGFDRFDRDLEIAQIVHRVEHAEDIDAVVGGLLHEGPHHIVGVIAVAQQVLPAQQHLDARIRQCLAQFAQTFPRVFAQETHAGVEGGAAPGLERPEADRIELAADRQHVLRAHAGGDE